MGDIADMMIDGTLCSQCGVYIGDAVEYPRLCPSCENDNRREAHAAVLARHQAVKKIPCSVCGKRVKAAGVGDHMRDVHGMHGWKNVRLDGRPEDNTWCWVSDGSVMWIAKADSRSAGGWTNDDTTEDFAGEVLVWSRIEVPSLPRAGDLAR